MHGAITGFVTGGVGNRLRGACFVEGTAVLTASGSVAIESIQPGDLVWSWDENTGDVALKEVVCTYENPTRELIHLLVQGEEIVTTPTHPFYSPGKGWVAAIDLQKGDSLVLVHGECVVVEQTQHELLERAIPVYNLQVQDYHTYYVTDRGILVHNFCQKNRTRKHFKMEKIGRMGERGYFGIKYSVQKGQGRSIRSIKIHPPHNNHGFHIQINKWNPITGKYTVQKRISLFKWLKRFKK